MSFSFIRIDDRVIHGQMVTRWSKEQKCDGIVAVDDKTAGNETLCTVLKSAVPDTIKTFIFTVDTLVEKYDKIQASDRSYFLIVKSPITLVRILESGISLDFVNVINVGPMSTRDDSVTVSGGASVLPQEAEAFNELEKRGFNIEFRLLPDTQKVLWSQVKNKFNV